MARLAEIERPSETERGGVTIVRPDAGLLIDLGELLEYRELLYFFVWRDIKVMYKQTLMGAAWAIIQPLFTMLLFTVIFGRVAKVPTDDLPLPIFFYIGLMLWMYFGNALARSTNSLVQHQNLITKVYFPRLLLPISAVISGWLDLAIAAVVLVGMMAYYQVEITLAILTLPLFFLLTVLTAVAAGIWLSALNAVYRDVRYAMPFLIQLWMFASPIAYSSALVPERYRTIYALNPMAGAVEGFRWSITGQGSSPGALTWVSLAAVLVMLISGIVFFHRLESHLVDVI